MEEFNIGDKVYFGFPGITLSGIILGFFTTDVKLAKVHCQYNDAFYYLPLTSLRTEKMYPHRSGINQALR